MKLSRKIIPALAMLVMSAIMLTTASFAWFVSSANVTASGMNVTLKSDSIYLLISSDKTNVTDIQNQNGTSATGHLATGYTTTDLRPVAHDAIDAATVETAGNWYYRTADATESSASTKSAQTLTTSLNGYVAKYTYYVTMAKGSPDGNNLALSEFTVTASGGTVTTPVCAILVCGTNVVEVGGLSTATSTTPGTDANTTVNNLKEAPGGDKTILANVVTDADVLTIDVYVYFNGNHTELYSDNLGALVDTAQVQFKLSVSESDT